MGAVTTRPPAMPHQVIGFFEPNYMLAKQRQRMFLANSSHNAVNRRWIDPVRLLPQQSKQNGAIGAVTMSGQRQRSVQLDGNPRGGGKQPRLFQLDGEAPRGPHRAHRVRARSVSGIDS